jgi:hypothetical protein
MALTKLSGIAQQPSENPLLEIDLLDGSQLEFVRRACKPTPLDDQAIVGDADLRRPNPNHASK